MSIRLLLIFAVTELLVSLSPGPAVFLVVSQGMQRGFKASVRGTLGIEICNIIFFGLSALGLGAILVASATLFQFVRWLGVAYLLFIGLKLLITTPKSITFGATKVTNKNSFALVSQGFITQMINPRAILFFTALLPQFISTTQSATRQFVLLGFISVLVEIPVLLTYGWLAAQGGQLIPQRFSSLPDRIAGVFLIGAGAGLAVIK